MFIFDNINLTVSLGQLMKNISTFLSSNKEAKENESNSHFPPQKSKRNLLLMISLLIFLGGIFLKENTKTEVTSHFSSDVIHNSKLHQAAVVAEVKGIFWLYVYTEKIKTVEDFSPDDFLFLKEKFWDVIEKNRIDYLNGEGSQRLFNKIRKAYPYRSFIKDFDSFINANKEGDLKIFFNKIEDCIKARQYNIFSDCIQ